MINIAQGQDAIIQNIRDFVSVIQQTQMEQLVR
jgi:hypothetical protein